MTTERHQTEAARQFAARWQGRGYEKGDSQVFWTELVTTVFGIANPSEFLRFEQQARLDHTSFIDVMIPHTHVMVEQKSLGKDLRQPIRQSDGTLLTPYQQAQRYSAALPYSERPRWIVVCNFAEFDVYDMEHPNTEPQRILLADLGRELYRLRFLVETGNEHLEREMEVSIQAGEIVGRIYDALLESYADGSAQTLRQLNILCVRLVFCFYAEDAGIFGRHDQFHDYLAKFDAPSMRSALLQLFETLNTPADSRSKYLRPELAAFPYTNGGLFAEQIDIPQFTDTLRDLLLRHASLDFDWSQISPTIFGAVFESTLNPETRRSGGMHYTSIGNIHRVIDPLFLDGLRTDFADICREQVTRRRLRRLQDFQQRLATLTFLDPACGSGNFLTETYLSLRRLENEVIRAIYSTVPLDAFTNPIRVSIHQFHGIELNDFAVTVATTALWISEAQMMAETERIIHHDIDFLPLRSYANIREGNALSMDWQTLCPKESLSYIIGNPPFVGARLMAAEQKEDMLRVFGHKWKNVGNLDYVCAWYKLAADFIRGSGTRCALVSTNSVCQGESVANLWKPLFAEGVHIDFAHRTFRWDSEASLKAHVHCIIVGFSCAPCDRPKLLFDNGQVCEAAHINAYLVDAPDTWVESRNTPLCDVPAIGIGNKPIDGGNYLFTKEEMEEFIRREPKAAAYFRPWYGAQEFIHREPRYCLWLGDCTPKEITSMPLCYERVKNVRNYRLASTSAGTVKLADKPTRFHVENMPETTYLLVPRVSSEKRRYVPIGFITPDVLCSDSVHIIPSATLYHFGILESNVHMAWMRAVCGRLEMRYRYSKEIVYNNFPWPEATPERQAEISRTAQAILDARALYPDSSLADLYDPVAMPRELLEAHRRNDRAVMAAYAMPPATTTEADCVSRLFDLYRRLTGGLNG